MKKLIIRLIANENKSLNKTMYEKREKAEIEM